MVDRCRMAGTNYKRGVTVAVGLVAAIRPVEAFIHGQGNAIGFPLVAVGCRIGATGRVEIEHGLNVGGVDIIAQRRCRIGHGYGRFAAGQLQGMLALGAGLIRPILKAAANGQHGLCTVDRLRYSRLFGRRVINHVLKRGSHVDAARRRFVLDRDNRNVAGTIHNRDTEVNGRAFDRASACGRGGVNVDIVRAVGVDRNALHELAARIRGRSLRHLNAVNEEVRGLAHAGAYRRIGNAERGAYRVQSGFRQRRGHGDRQNGNSPRLRAGRAVFVRDDDLHLVFTGD